jgi:hypothetical protein
MQLAAFTNRSANAANNRTTNTNTISYGATPSYPIDPAWYDDTEATGHFTNDLVKLSVHEPYNGNDQVQTAVQVCALNILEGPCAPCCAVSCCSRFHFAEGVHIWFHLDWPALLHTLQCDISYYISGLITF